jgi:leader peptidase (prepilin peptidase) / N-methyltransferase
MAHISLVDRLADWRERPLAAVAVVLLAAVACTTSMIVAPGFFGLLGAGLALIVIAIAVIDGRYFIIPNELSAAAFGLALTNAAAQMPQAMWEAVGIALLRAAVLGLLFFGLRTLYRRVRGRDGIGLGDVKLAAVAGAWLDWLTLPIVIEIAALAAIAVYGLRHYAGGRGFDPALKFPFGLFLAPSIWFGWLIEATVLAPF